MSGLLASDPAVFGLFTVLLMGGAGFMTGQALAMTWRPVSQAFGYCLLLGAANRFLVFSLFGGPLLSLHGYILDTAVITAICLMAYRFTRAARMVRQYPWLYERSGLFGWRPRRDG
jgi:hypothetical protein